MEQIQIQNLFNEIYQKYHHPKFLNSDPLQFPRRFKNPEDQEIAALLCSMLAYGKVDQIHRSINHLFQRIFSCSKSLTEFTDSLQKKAFLIKAKKTLKGFYHRFNRDEDVLEILKLFSWTRKEYRSIGNFFLSYHHESETTIEKALTSMMSHWKSRISINSQSVYYLLSSPEGLSCCKRWCMLLRWMGRKDTLDLGLWRRNSPLIQSSASLLAHQLIMPLDTHTGRLSQHLQLTQKKTLNWKVALEITENLKKFHPEDPTKIDFSLTRYGMFEKLP